MKKVKALLISAGAVLLITAATVTVFASPNNRHNLQNNNSQSASCPAVCEGTGRQNCILNKDCPYYENSTSAYSNSEQAGRGQGAGRGNGKGRMSNRSGACRMA